MALEVHTHPHGDERRTTVGLFIAKSKLWLTADRERVVEDGDPDAAYLFAAPGDELPLAEAERYGLVKAKAPAADKKRTPKADK